MSRFAEWRRDLGLASTLIRRRPFSALIQVTNRCNMRCAFCDFWANGARPEHELKVDDFARIADALAALGRFIISVEGGEPFVRPDLIDIVRVLSRQHITVLYTNGWYVDAENAAALFAAGLTQVGVSIDYPDAERHDAERGPRGTFERALRAVELLRDAAPHGGRQVHVMTVYMRENAAELESLLQLSAALRVGHVITLLSTHGTRRAPGGSWPEGEVSAELLRLHDRYPHFRVFRRYLALMDAFLDGEGMPTCRAGTQSLNIDHLGNVAPCIEKIGAPVGNVRETPLAELVARLRARDDIAGCQDCWTYCRGISQIMGQGGTLDGWVDLSGRMRSR